MMQLTKVQYLIHEYMIRITKFLINMYNPTSQKEKAEESIRFPHTLGGMHPQFCMNEMEDYFHKEILKRQADDNPFTFIRRSDTDATIFRINHLRLQIEEAKQVRDFLLINIQKGHKEFIIDITNCEFMDSTFLGAIIQVSKKINRENGKIILAADPEKIRILHALKELNKYLTITSSVDESVMYFL